MTAGDFHCDIGIVLFDCQIWTRSDTSLSPSLLSDERGRPGEENDDDDNGELILGCNDVTSYESKIK